MDDLDPLEAANAKLRESQGGSTTLAPTTTDTDDPLAAANAKLRLSQGKPEWRDEQYSRGSRLADILRTHMQAGKTFEDAAPHIQRSLGVDPESVRPAYRMEEERAKAASLPSNWLTGELDPSTLRNVGKVLPGVSSYMGWSEARDYGRAAARIHQGQATDQDYQTAAMYEEKAKRKAGQSLGDTLTQTAASLPSFAAETMTGARALIGAKYLVRGAEGTAAATAAAAGRGTLNTLARGTADLAASTALTPALWAEQGAKNLNEAKDRPEWRAGLQAYGAALATGTIQNAILGRLSGAAKEGESLLGAVARRTPKGILEQQVADVVTGATGLNTGYGLLGDLAKGDLGDAGKSLAVQTMTFATFAALHGREKAAKEVPVALADGLKDLKDAGWTSDEAVKAMSAIEKATPTSATREDATKNFSKEDLEGPLGGVIKARLDSLPTRTPAHAGEPVKEQQGAGSIKVIDPEFGNGTDRNKSMKDLHEHVKAGGKGVYVDMDIDNMKGLVNAAGEDAARGHRDAMVRIIRDELSKVGETKAFRHAGDPLGDEHSALVKGADRAAVAHALNVAKGRIQAYAEANNLHDIPYAKSEKASLRGTGVSVGIEPLDAKTDPRRTIAEAEAGTETSKDRLNRPPETSKTAPSVAEVPSGQASEPLGAPKPPKSTPEAIERFNKLTSYEQTILEHVAHGKDTSQFDTPAEVEKVLDRALIKMGEHRGVKDALGDDLAKLTDLERYIVGGLKEKSLRQLGTELGMTYEGVRYHERKANAKLGKTKSTAEENERDKEENAGALPLETRIGGRRSSTGKKLTNINRGQFQQHVEKNDDQKWTDLSYHVLEVIGKEADNMSEKQANQLMDVLKRVQEKIANVSRYDSQAAQKLRAEVEGIRSGGQVGQRPPQRIGSPLRRERVEPQAVRGEGDESGIPPGTPTPPIDATRKGANPAAPPANAGDAERPGTGTEGTAGSAVAPGGGGKANRSVGPSFERHLESQRREEENRPGDAWEPESGDVDTSFSFGNEGVYHGDRPDPVTGTKPGDPVPGVTRGANASTPLTQEQIDAAVLAGAFGEGGEGGMGAMRKGADPGKPIDPKTTSGVSAAWRWFHDQLRYIRGEIAPRTSRLNEAAGNAIGDNSAVPDYEMRAAQYFKQQILDPLVPEARAQVEAEFKAGGSGLVPTERDVQLTAYQNRLRYGAAMHEERFRQARAHWQEIERQELEKAARAFDPEEIMKARQAAAEAHDKAGDIRTMIGTHGLYLEKNFQDTVNSPGYKAFRERWVPFSDKAEELFRSAMGIDAHEVIDSISQLDRGVFHARALQEGEVGDAGVATVSRRGNLMNPRQTKLGAANTFTGSAERYDVDPERMIEYTLAKRMRNAAKAQMYRKLLEAKDADGKPLAYPLQPGSKILPEYRVLPTRKLPPGATEMPNAKEINLAVHPEVYNEVVRSLELAGIDQMMDTYQGNKVGRGVKKLVSLPTAINLVGIAEGTTHCLNTAFITLRSAGIRSLPDMFKQIGRSMLQKPEAVKELMDLSEHGLTKAHKAEWSLNEQGMLWGGKTDPTSYVAKAQQATIGKFMDRWDDAMRLTMSHAFDRIAEAYPGVVKSTQNKRDFVNQLGNYQRTTQHWMVALFRDLGIGPFATAATNNVAQSIRTLALGRGLRTTDYMTQAKLRAELGLQVAGVIGTGFLVNYLLHHRVDGDDNTPLGGLKLPGNNGYIDMAAIANLRRGSKTIGLQSIIEGERYGGAGAKSGTMLSNALESAGEAAVHPAAGPGVSLARSAIWGKDVIGRDVVPKNEQHDAWAKLQAAILNENPMAEAVTKLLGYKTHPGRKEETTQTITKGLGLGSIIKKSNQPPGKPLPTR